MLFTLIYHSSSITGHIFPISKEGKKANNIKQILIFQCKSYVSRLSEVLLEQSRKAWSYQKKAVQRCPRS